MRKAVLVPSNTPLNQMLKIFQSTGLHLVFVYDVPDVDQAGVSVVVPSSAVVVGSPKLIASPSNDSRAFLTHVTHTPHYGATESDAAGAHTHHILRASSSTDVVGHWHMYVWQGASLRLRSDLEVSQPQPPIVGLVTLEDVIEALLQTEIVDETDVYSDMQHADITHTLKRTKSGSVMSFGQRVRGTTEAVAIFVSEDSQTAMGNALLRKNSERVILLSPEHSEKKGKKDKKMTSKHELRATLVSTRSSTDIRDVDANASRRKPFKSKTLADEEKWDDALGYEHAWELNE